MASQRKVKKITPHRAERFDTQFWPVVVALVVLSGITAGAILTLLKGPWMWGSLLGLPIVVAVTIVVLQSLDNKQLRRALQFAIIISMAVHMMILVFASLTDIFGKERTRITETSIQRPQKVLLVSKQNQPKVWEQVNKHETPEPEMKVERETKATRSEVQPVPVKQNSQNTDSQVSQSAERSQTVPRMDESLSELRRSENSRRKNDTRATPKTSQQVAKSESAQPTKQADSSASEAAVKVERQAEKQTEAALSAPQKTMEQSTSAPKVNRTAERRATSSKSEATEATATSQARMRRNSLSMPTSSAQSALATNEQPKTRNPEKTAPRDVTEPITRREQKSIAERRPIQDLPTPQSNRRQAIAKSSAKRNDNTPAPPSISEPTSNPINPRRSRRDAPMTVSTQPLESPSTAVNQSKTGSSRMQPTAASVSQQRSEAVGSQISRNISNQSGSVASTATTASDMAARRRSTSNNSQPSLTSVQSSNIRRSVANNRQVETALAANTSAPAPLSGSQNPATRTATSSAATVDTASTAHRSEISAQKGEASVDVGPTKVVTETTAQKRSGGGRPETGEVQFEKVARTRQSSGSERPTLDARADQATVAENKPNTKPASSSTVDPTESQVASDRTDGDQTMAGEPLQTLREGPNSDQSNAEVVGLLSENRSRANRESANASSSFDDEDDEERKGNERTRLSLAPTTDSKQQFSVAESDTNGESGSVAGALAAKAVEIAMKGRGVSNLAPTAGRLALQAATSLPVIESGSTRRSQSNASAGPSTESDASQTSTRRSSSRGSGLALNSKATEIEGGASREAAANQEGSRTAAESMVEVQRGERAGSIELKVDAVEGPVGIASEATSRVGVRARPASRESNEIQSSVDTRFRRKTSGAQPALNPDAVIAKEAFQGRTPTQGGGGPQTEAAIELGLEFLARHQEQDGSWTLGKFDQESTLHNNQLQSDTAATGLALIAFQGAGYNHREFKYAIKINHAIEWMIANQQADGCLYIDVKSGQNANSSNNSCRMYSHAIATLALTEAFGMTQDEKLRKPIEKALEYIENTQDRAKGGWRYFAQVEKRNTDTSVTGWMLMSLQSARLSGFEINPKVINGIERWLDSARGAQSEGQFRYNPYGVDTKEFDREKGRLVSPTMTSVGLLMRLYLGWDRNDARFQSGCEYLLTEMPSDATIGKRDTYYWYYATQVMRHAGGNYWQKWNEKLHPLLIDSQEQKGEMAGSWHPYLPVPDRWGHAGGRLYVTTMNLLSLEVNYRLLPLYDETSK